MALGLRWLLLSALACSSLFVKCFSHPAAATDLMAWEHGGSSFPRQELLSDEDAIAARHLLQELSQQQTGAPVKTGSVLAWGDLSRIGPTPPEVLTGRVVKVAAGRLVAMALLDTREVVVWNAANQYGLMNVTKGIQGQVVDIAAGDAHCLALLASGSVTAWGRNLFNLTYVPAELRPGGSAKAVAVAASFQFSLALLANGTVMSWGDGFGAEVPAAARANVTSIAAGEFYAVAVLKNGTLVQWGFNNNITLLPGVQNASVGTDQVAAVLKNGSVVALATDKPKSVLYGDILPEVLNVPPAARSHVVAVSAAQNITLALRDTGEVVGWGHEAPGITVISSLPLEAKSGVVAIGCDENYALAVVQGVLPAFPPPNPPPPPPPHPAYPPAPPPYQPANQVLTGSVVVWGDLHVIGSPPANVTSGHVIKIAAGYKTGLALLDTHEVVAWTTDNTDLTANVPAAIQGQVADIAAGTNHTVALLLNGSIVAWGANSHNQTNVPADLRPGGTAKAVSIAAGYWHTLAVLANGSVAAWGWDDRGVCDVPATAQSGVKSVAAAGQISLAVLSDGSLVLWGGHLPQVPAAYQYGVVSAAVGTDQIVLVLRNGSVVTYADRDDGPLFPNILDVVLEVPPAARSNVVAVSAHENTSMALLDTGEVMAWGWAPPGSPISPVPLAARSKAIAIAASGGYCMALIATPGDGMVIAPSLTMPPPLSLGTNTHLTTGAVAGIAIGGVALLALVASGILILLMRNRTRSQTGKRHVYTAQKSGRSGQAFKGTAACKELTNVLRPQETFMRFVAPEYSWTVGSSLQRAMRNVEAGVNDTQLDNLQQAGQSMSRAIELSRSELCDQVQLLADGLLGRGSTALVFKCVWPSRFGPNSLLAIKVLKDGSDADVGAIQSFAYEAKLLAAMRHPNVVRLYGYCLEPPTMCLILELLPTSLKQKLYGIPAAEHDTQPSQSSDTDTTQLTSAISQTVASAGNTIFHSKPHADVPMKVEPAPNTSSASGTDVFVTVTTQPPSLTRSSPTFPTPEPSALVTANTHTAVVTPMTLLEIVRTSTDIAAGLAYLHSQEEPAIPESEEAGMIMQISSPKDKRIVHRDLKPANILLNSEGAAKITDFGLARDHDHTTVGAVNMGAGTVQYMAPEQLVAARAGRAGVGATNLVDVYSLGMMMWEMLAGEAPWKGKSEDMIFAVVMNHRRPPLPGAPDQDGEHVSVKGQLRHMPGVHDHPLLPQFTSIIQACWHQRDRQRPTAAAVHGMLTDLLKRLK